MLGNISLTTPSHLLDLEVAVFSCIGQLPDDVRHCAAGNARWTCKLKNKPGQRHDRLLRLRYSEHSMPGGLARPSWASVCPVPSTKVPALSTKGLHSFAIAKEQ